MFPIPGTVANDGTMDNADRLCRHDEAPSTDSPKGFLTFDVDYFIKNGQDLIARTKNVQADHRTKAFNVDRLPGLALVDQGGDLVAGAGMDERCGKRHVPARRRTLRHESVHDRYRRVLDLQNGHAL